MNLFAKYQYDRMKKDDDKKIDTILGYIGIGIMIIILIIAFVMFPTKVEGAEIPHIDLDAVMQIESSHNPSAYNKNTQATGLMQITPVCLAEWNNYHPNSPYSMLSMKNPQMNMRVGNWYLNQRIPQMLEYYRLPVTVDNILIAYNGGINCVVKWKVYEETRDYLVKYKKLTKM